MKNLLTKNQFKQEVIKLLDTYKPYDSHEQESFEKVNLFLEQYDDITSDNQNGHITGSAWIINKERSKVLLTHHQKLNIWVQLGGHIDSGESPFEGAYREAIEESGLSNITPLSKEIFDIDVHLFPERKNTKAHYHYDFRFLFEADDNEEIIVSKESKDVKWIPIEEIDKYSNEHALIRMKDKIKD